MRVGVVFYHKNIRNIYDWRWIQKCVYSIINQTHSDLLIYELNYGLDNFSILNELKIKRDFNFYNRNFNNHAEAINFLFEESLNHDVDVLFNTNMDDYYELNRIECQLRKIEEGYDVVSSNFKHIDTNDNSIRNMAMNHLDIKDELKKEHNLIAHPSVCWSKKFMKKNKYDPTEIPREDLRLWQRTQKGFKFYICEEYLLNYRVHNNQITQQTTTREIPQIQENIQYQNNYNNVYVDKCKTCGEVKNKVLYNYCQRCNSLY